MRTSIPTGRASVEGELEVPARALGLVIFAHGSGSGRFSPRNRFVAEGLREAGLATLLLDLLTREEEEVDDVTAEHRFDIGLLAGRLLDAARFARTDRRTRGLPPAFFGASTGAAAALVAEARGAGVAAIVSRGGRPDLAGAALARVRAPTLLIVGGADHPDVLRWNRESVLRLAGEKRLESVPGATHLFEEPGALRRVVELARDWFVLQLSAAASRTGG